MATLDEVMAQRPQQPWVTHPHWFGRAERPLLGWVSLPPDAAVGASGVAVLPPVGYEWWSTHRTLRATAERLARDGHVVLRVDYEGTGDSAGEQYEPDRVARWRASAAAAVAELRRLGVERVTLLGLRLGALIALLDGSELAADALIAWAPVTSGRRYAREIRLLADRAPDGAGLPAGTLLNAGSVFRADTLADLAALDVNRMTAAPAPRVLLVAASPDPGLERRLSGLGSSVTQLTPVDCERPLSLPAEYATVPEQAVGAIDGWLGPSTRSAAGRLAARSAASLRGPNGEELVEAVIELGQAGLVAVETRRPELNVGAATLLLLNSGSEPHVGPGRAWVEYARALAADGHRCIRADFRGWGESPDDDRAPGRPYDEHCVEDTVALVRALRERDGGPIVLAGLCASAWAALRAVLREPVDGVVALNPQLYWRPGDPVEATMTETRRRRTPERRREELGRRLRLWTVLDQLGSRPWSARWLDDLVRTGVPVTLAFACGDDGIEYLRNRVDRRLRAALRAGTIELVEIAGIDHSMGRVWLRERIVAVLRARLEAVGADVAQRALPAPAGR